MMRRSATRWRTPFARWVRVYTTRNLARDLGRKGYSVSQLAIYHWVAGRCAPRIEHARAIQRLSRGQLHLDDIYRRRATSAQAQVLPRAGGPARVAPGPTEAPGSHGR